MRTPINSGVRSLDARNSLGFKRSLKRRPNFSANAGLSFVETALSRGIKNLLAKKLLNLKTTLIRRNLDFAPNAK